MSRFARIACLIVFAIYLYVAERMLTGINVAFGGKAALAALLLAPFAWVLWLPLVYWREDDAVESRLERALERGAFVCMALTSFLFFFNALRDLSWAALRVFGQASRTVGWYGDRASILVFAAAVAAMLIGAIGARGRPGVTRVEVPLEGLSERFDGFRIAQISDLHIGTMIGRKFVERVVSIVNSLDPDLVALTGDIGDGDAPKLREDVHPLSNLKARDGRFYVTGNHEYYWNADQWIAEIGRQGIEPLLNRHHAIERGGEHLVVAGVPDVGSGRARPREALMGAPSAATRILLAHQPSLARDAAAAGFDLQLSGHTHGGQFIPWTWVAHLAHPVVKGLAKIGKMWIYVNRGTGTWGPPVRLGSPSEITLLTLRRAASPKASTAV